MKISVMPGYEDTFSRALVSVIDITDQLKTADALRRAHNELEERVRERTAELSNTNETLRKEIAERIKAEEALRESEERFRTVADYAYDWEDWSGPNAELLFVSPSCERITGYTPEEFYRHVGADELLNKIVHPDDKETWAQHILHRTDNLQITTIEFRIIRKDSEVRWIEHSCLPVYGKDGKWLGRRASNRDITGRKLAEAALQASEQTLRAVFNTIPESILVIDGSGAILHANEMAIQRLGAGSSNQFIGANVFDILPPDTADGRRQKVAELLQSRQPAYFEDSRLGRYMFNSIYPILDANGEVEKIAIYALDITDHKLAEEQMHQLASQLITIQEDEHLNIARDLHDEIGQAMAVLGFNLNALLAEVPPEQTSLQERIQDCIQILDTTTEHLRQIAHQLRPPALDTLPLSQSLRGLCLSFNRQTQLKINFSAEEKIPSVPNTFVLSFYRLAQEGLTNVVKHAKASSVWVSLDYDQGLVSLQVEDDGQGFNPQITPPGIGLQGLRERFQMLRGSLDIESVPGKGTRLDGYLPWQP
jgi:PAS domain S-box-containing protein